MNKIEQYVKNNLSKYVTDENGAFSSTNGFIKQLENSTKSGATSGVILALVGCGSLASRIVKINYKL